MERNRELIEKTIIRRLNKNDPVREFSIRNKASPIAEWGEFKPYSLKMFESVYLPNVDGVQLRFKYVVLVFNGRYKNK